MVDDRIEASPLLGVLRRTQELGEVAANWIRTKRQRQQNIAGCKSLLEQDDHLLDDMGISRGELLRRIKHNRWSIGTRGRRND